MIKVLAMGGMPGTGKSTIMNAFMARTNGAWQRRKLTDLVDAEVCGNVHIFGKYDEGEVFPGTDRLSMAVQPKVVELLRSANEGVFVFEGDRLFTGSLMHELDSMPHVELLILYITAPQEVLQARYEERGSNQTEQFINGRRTKCEKIISSMTLYPLVESYENVTPTDLNVIVDRMVEFVGGV